MDIFGAAARRNFVANQFSPEMKISLTHDEMLQAWLLAKHLTPLRSDAAVTRRDGIDLSRLATAEMRGWYLDLLDHGETRHLAPSDLARDVALRRNDDGSASVLLPEGVRRVLDVKLTCWRRSAQIVDAGSEIAARQHNRYARGGVCSPVAVRTPDGLQLYSVPPGAAGVAIERLLVAMDRGEAVYEMDDSALSLINPL